MNLPINQQQALERVIAAGDLRALSPEQRVAYYKAICESVGLNPITQPLEYLDLKGKLTLYVRKAATDQLRQIHKVSIRIMDRQNLDDVYVVTAQARTPEGREDESIGAVDIKGLRGDALSNAWMKAETKAKRRVTLSVCGLSFLDESEVQDVEGQLTPDQKFGTELQAWSQPVQPTKYVYKIEEPSQAQLLWLDKNGLVQDNENGLWISPKRIEALEKFEVVPTAPAIAAEEVPNV